MVQNVTALPAATFLNRWNYTMVRAQVPNQDRVALIRHEPVYQVDTKHQRPSSTKVEPPSLRPAGRYDNCHIGVVL